MAAGELHGAGGVLRIAARYLLASGSRGLQDVADDAQVVALGEAHLIIGAMPSHYALCREYINEFFLFFDPIHFGFARLTSTPKGQNLELGEVILHELPRTVSGLQNAARRV